MSKRKEPESVLEPKSALERRCRLVDGRIMDALESAAVSGDFDWVHEAMEAALRVLDAESVLRVVTPTPCVSSEDDFPSDGSDLGFLPVNTGPSRPEWSSAYSAFDVVYPGAGPDDVVDSDSEGGYVSGYESGYDTDSTVWGIDP